MDVLVERVAPAETFELRRRVLRPHQNVDQMVLAGDDDPSTGCFVARDARTGEVVSTASVRRELPPWYPDAPPGRHLPDGPVPDAASQAAGEGGSNAWRLRGMATAEPRRGEGLGGLVLDAVVDHVTGEGGGLLWCSARVPAQEFYKRAGFEVLGEMFEEPEIGPHVLMWRVVKP
jgi:GNAT superfamily N-acetyltransferase